MTTVTYSVKNVSTAAFPDSEYASVCWEGVTTTYNDECSPTTTVDTATYCIDVHIGTNTECGGTTKVITGSYIWNGVSFSYTITQPNDPGDKDCTKCEFGAPTCQIISVRTLPMYVTRDVETVDVIMEWYEISEDNCGNITRVRRKDQETVTVEEWPECLEEEKVVTGSFTRCSVTFNYEYHMIADKVCCPEDGITCEVGEVIYDVISIPYPIKQEGKYEINYYFDYKQLETKDCVTKTTYFRKSGVWVIDYDDARHDDCKAITITGSVEHPCGGDDIQLSIVRNKNHAAEDCTEVCDPGDYKCVDVESIKYYIRSDCKDWVYDDDRQDNDKDEGCTWTEMPKDYKVKWYGEEIMVTWNYTRYVIYDDCSIAVTTDNLYEYTLMIPPYSDTSEGGGSPGEEIEPKNKCLEDDISMRIEFGDIPTDEHITKLRDENGYDVDKNCGIFNICYQQEETPEGCGRCVDSFEINLSIDGKHYENGDADPCDSYSLENECEVELEYSPDWVHVTKDPARPKNGCKIRYSADENKYEYREGSVIWHIVGTDCYDTVRITQLGAGEDRNNDEIEEDNPEGSCDCQAMGAYPISTKIPADGGNNITVGTYIYDSCLISVTASNGFTAADGVITGSIPKNTKCTEVTHSTTVTFRCEGGDTKTSNITVTQEAGGIPALVAEGDANCCDGGTITVRLKT